MVVNAVELANIPVQMSVGYLLEYTQWQREKWYDWLRQHGNDVLKTSVGPHGDSRFACVGDVIRHIFSAEKRYIDRLTGRQLTDPSVIRADDIEALGSFGRESRKSLRDFLETLPAQQWDVAEDYTIGNFLVRATPRKILFHILLHEIRHWAQIATLFRLNGLPVEFHDFLFSPVFGGGLIREPATA